MYCSQSTSGLIVFITKRVYGLKIRHFSSPVIYYTARKLLYSHNHRHATWFHLKLSKADSFLFEIHRMNKILTFEALFYKNY